MVIMVVVNVMVVDVILSVCVDSCMLFINVTVLSKILLIGIQ